MFFTVLPSYYKFNIKTLFHQIEFHLCDKGENSTAMYPSSVADQLQIQCQTHLVIATLLEGHKFSEIVLVGFLVLSTILHFLEGVQLLYF
jgi:hypothetical protein